VFFDAGLVKSKTEFRNFVKNGAIKVQDIKITDAFARMVIMENGKLGIIQK